MVLNEALKPNVYSQRNVQKNLQYKNVMNTIKLKTSKRT